MKVDSRRIQISTASLQIAGFAPEREFVQAALNSLEFVTQRSTFGKGIKVDRRKTQVHTAE